MKSKRVIKIICFILCLLVSAVGILFVLEMLSTKKISQTVEFSNVEAVCELATLECYYHNVIEKENHPDNWWNKLWKEKKYFLEYEGIVKMGVDFKKVKIDQPDKKGVVRIYVPEAKVFNEDEVTAKTIGELVSEKGVFVKITTEEQAKLLAEAQENMKKNAAEDKVLLGEAHENAKALLEQYVVNIGDLLGKKFTVKWVAENSI